MLDPKDFEHDDEQRHAAHTCDEAGHEVLDEWAMGDYPCQTCGKVIQFIEGPKGSGNWWAHVDHPADGHEAIPTPEALARHTASYAIAGLAELAIAGEIEREGWDHVGDWLRNWSLRIEQGEGVDV